jgi:hypothetical protein
MYPRLPSTFPLSLPELLLVGFALLMLAITTTIVGSQLACLR